MIDHVSIAVSDLERSTRFYETVLATLGFGKLRVRPHTVGFGKSYPEFWLNSRPAVARLSDDSGMHVCLRADSVEAVQAFHAAALAAGGTDAGAPGPRPHYSDVYYGAFIADPDGNRVEAVTFLGPSAGRA